MNTSKKRATKKHRKYTDNDKVRVIGYFKAEKNNSDKEIAEALDLDIGWVSLMIREYYKDRMNNINKIRNSNR